MSAAEAAALRRNEFRTKLKKAIEDATPKPTTESQADRLVAQGSKDASHTLRGELETQKRDAAGPMEAAVAKEVPASEQPAPPKTELAPEPLGSPPAPVPTAAVVPAPLPPEKLDYSEDRAPTDKAMADGGVTKEQLEKGNEPSFQQNLSARSTAEKHEASAEAKYRQSEAAVQGKAHVQSQAAMADGLSGMHGLRALHVAGVIGQQVGTTAKDAAERKRITDTVTGIKDRTRADVDALLKKMEVDATAAFERGLARAEQAYHDTFEDAKGGVGTWLTTWGSSWERLIEDSLAKARVEYMHQVDIAIEEVADCVDGNLAAATQRVKDGLKEVDTFVAGLDAKVMHFGEEAKKEVAGEFEAMEKDIDEHRDALINKLAEQYKASHERMLAMEEKLREENKSLWQRVYDATVGLIKKIIAFKDMLLNVLAKAADVIGDIISDPIGFLGNLVEGVMRGLKSFMSHIGKHLQKGLMEWLFGALGGAGLVMPENFDLQGIVSIVLQVLGLTYANFRARAVAIVGEPVVAALEKTAEVFKIIVTEGIPGLWRFIKEKLNDLKSMVLDAILDYIKEKVIVAGITWVIGLLNPASAFFKACKAIYDIVMFFVERGSQILALVNAIIDSMAAIAKGSLDTAAQWVENALAKAIPVAIGFLASLLGLGDISGTIRKVIEKAQEPVNKAIDWVINQAVKLVKAIGRAFGIGKKDPKDEDKAHKDVKHQAGARFIEMVGHDPTVGQAETAAAAILQEFHPLGLEKFEIRPAEDESGWVVFAQASPGENLYNLLTSVDGIVAMHATVTVSGSASPVEGASGMTMFTPYPASSGGSVVGGRGVTHLDPASAPPGMAARDPHAYRPSGAIAIEPEPGSNALEIVGWNTGAPIRGSNVSHAEHQFANWYTKETNSAWRHKRVDAIHIHISRSPCGLCVADLISVATFTPPGAKLSLEWDELHTGKNPTTADHIKSLEASWKSVKGPRPPSSDAAANKAAHTHVKQNK